VKRSESADKNKAKRRAV